MLVEMMQANPTFQSLPRTEKLLIERLAEEFEVDDTYLTFTPEELTKHTGIGTRQQWHDFLNNEIVRAFIKGQMASLANVAQRKAFSSLSKNAAAGDVQSAKQINELSGILNSGDNNKVIVLHQIQRPTTHTTKEQSNEETSNT